MTDMTPRLALPLLHAGQAQKEMGHNEALGRVDMLMQTAVEAVGMDTPPGDPDAGQCWIVGPSPGGAWAGQADAIAGWTDGGWRFVAAREGMGAWSVADAVPLLHRDGSWRSGEIRGTQVIIDGDQVLGARQAAIADPAGGTTVDAEARTAIATLLAMLRAHGLIAV